MLWARSTTKDYIKAEHKLHSTSKLFISQVIIPQVILVSSLVAALSSVSHEGLHQSWKQTSFYLKVSHFTSHYTTSHAFILFLAYLYTTGTQHGNLHPARWPSLFCGPTQEPYVSHSQHRKNRERFWKKCWRMDRRLEISKEEIPGSKRSMYGCILTYSRL